MEYRKMNNILLSKLIKAYKAKDLNMINAITQINLPLLDDELIDYLKKLTLDEIFNEITLFNASALNDNYKTMSFYFFNNNWIVMNISVLEQEDILNSVGYVIESTIENLRHELKIIDIIKNTEKGILQNNSDCFK